MDYSNIIDDLQHATLFDLHRIQIAINHKLENPQRIAEIRKRLKPGQVIQYFDSTGNRLIEATVKELKRTQLLVKDTHDQKLWNIPFFWVNLDEVNTDINSSKSMGLDKSQLKVGDIVGFPDRQNNDCHGEIIRLNQKTATIKTNLDMEWLVGYHWLYRVIDGEAQHPRQLTGKVIDVT